MYVRTACRNAPHELSGYEQKPITVMVISLELLEPLVAHLVAHNEVQKVPIPANESALERAISSQGLTPSRSPRHSSLRGHGTRLVSTLPSSVLELVNARWNSKVLQGCTKANVGIYLPY